MDHRTELRLIVELARIGNARRAAQLLGVSQSTLSEAMTRIEAAYGAPLFIRDQRGSRPTAFGDVIVNAARRSLSILDSARREIDLMRTFDEGRLSIGAHPMLVEPYLTPAVARILRRYPKLRFRIQGADPDELLHQLRDRKIDLFIGVKPDGSLSGVHVEDVDIPEPVVFCRSGHPLAHMPPQGIEVIPDYPIIDWHMPNWFYEQFSSKVPLEQGTIQDMMEATRGVEFQDSGAMIALVKQTDALAVAAFETIRADVEAGVLAVLRLPEDQDVLMRPLSVLIATLEARTLPPIAPLMIEELKAVIAEACAQPLHPEIGETNER